jgi:hypothetical protein
MKLVYVPTLEVSGAVLDWVASSSSAYHPYRILLTEHIFTSNLNNIFFH